jgi:hypothetical protein
MSGLMKQLDSHICFCIQSAAICYSAEVYEENPVLTKHVTGVLKAFPNDLIPHQNSQEKPGTQQL